MLGSDSPPEVVAASFAIGVAISFTPLFGLHWIIALLLALILRLNKVDVLLGTLVVNPLTLPAVAAVAIPIGRFLLRARREAIAHLPWHEVFRRSFWTTAGPTMKAIGLQMVGRHVLSLRARRGAHVRGSREPDPPPPREARRGPATEGDREEAARGELSPPSP